MPSTALETEGERLKAEDLVRYRDRAPVVGLAEFMSFGQIFDHDGPTLGKLIAFEGVHINGHAPLLSRMTSPFIAFCTDDRHLDHIIRGAIAAGAPAAYRSSSWSAAQVLELRDRGHVAPGYRAALCCRMIWKPAGCAASSAAGTWSGRTAFRRGRPRGHRSVQLDPIDAGTFAVPVRAPTGPVIGIIPGTVLIEHLRLGLPYHNGLRDRDLNQDVLKACVFSRRGKNCNVGRGFAKGFGLRQGALASSVGHDSHNVITVGCTDADVETAVNRLIEIQGGVVAVPNGRIVAELSLPVVGLISDPPFEDVREGLRAMREGMASLGRPLAEPLLQLAFLPLTVIPHLKIADHGLVDVDLFEPIAA